MIFVCERDLLAEALTTVARAVSTRGGSLPVLSGVRLELASDQLTLTGSDLDLTISATIEVNGSSDGVSVVPAKLASEIVRSFDAGKVTVDVGDSEAKIVSGRSNFSLRIIPAEEFPQLVRPAGEAVTLEAAQFADALRQVVPAASSDDARPILTGVLIAAEGTGLRLVATDSYRLAIRDLPDASANWPSGDESVLVPSRALKELTSLVSDAERVELVLGERDALFRVGGVELMTRLIEGDFPNYRSLIPDSHPNRLTVSRSGLMEAVKRVRIMTARESTPVRMVQQAEGLELVAVSQELGQAHEQIDAKYEGTELTVAFNAEFLVAGIDATVGDEITLETVDALKPALVRSGDSPDFLYLLMPVRVA